MFEMNQIKVYVGDNGHVCLSQEDFGSPDDTIVFFNPCQAEIIAKAILLAAKEATKINEEAAASDG
jgi:hypothetical protein